MKITRIDFAGVNGRFATIQRKDEYMLAELLSPEAPDGRQHWIEADDETDIRSAADLLFCFLEGHDGTNSDIHDIYMRLLPLSNI
jgi:hypothetical protein